MRQAALILLLWLVQIGFCHAQATGEVPSFATHATFTFKGSQRPLSNVVATIEPHMVSGYYWMRLHFYSFAPDASDMPSISKGNTKSMDHRLSAMMEAAQNAALKDMANEPALMTHAVDIYDKGQAQIQFSLDKDFNVTQIDAAVPGSSCTIAGDKVSPKTIVQDYKVTGNRVTFKIHGVFPCDVPPGLVRAEIPPFGIDADVDAQVYKVSGNN